jgi:hypothetical protein
VFRWPLVCPLPWQPTFSEVVHVFPAACHRRSRCLLPASSPVSELVF